MVSEREIEAARVALEKLMVGTKTTKELVAGILEAAEDVRAETTNKQEEKLRKVIKRCIGDYLGLALTATKHNLKATKQDALETVAYLEQALQTEESDDV